MKGSFFMGAEGECRFEVRDMQFPELGSDEVLVRNEACGICGTDVHIYHGGEGSAPVKPPVVLGHEYAGVVEKIGSGVTTVQVGDYVAIDPNMYCGYCDSCRMGHKQNCTNLYALGVNTNGGFAEYSLCPQSQCFKINRDIPFEAAAMAEPLACAIHGIDKIGIRQGQSVLVVGGGTIGLLMVQLARLSGASKVILSEPIAMRREVGISVGATDTLDPLREDVAERTAEITGQAGADVVIECVGKPFAVEQAISAAGLGATVLLFSVPEPGQKAALPLTDVFKKELCIVGSIINPDTHQRAVNLINAGCLKLEELITHTYDLYHLEEAIHMQMSNESIKVIVKPHGQ